jgi:hypothetical protein
VPAPPPVLLLDVDGVLNAVQMELPEGWRRGVVFVRELGPRAAIAWVARSLYNEPYLSVPMHHHTTLDRERGGRAEYGWTLEGSRFALSASAEGAAAPLEPGSESTKVYCRGVGLVRDDELELTAVFGNPH